MTIAVNRTAASLGKLKRCTGRTLSEGCRACAYAEPTRSECPVPPAASVAADGALRGGAGYR